MEPGRHEHGEQVPDSARLEGDAAPDGEQRPLGALAVTGFLTLVIFGAWFGMYALNLARS